MNFQAVIFDLDGTLLDTLDDIANSANDTLAALNLPTHSVDAYRSFVGDGVGMLFIRATPAAWQTEARIDDCVSRFSKIYERRWNQRSRPYDGIPELLGELTKRDVRLTVLSNKPHAFTVKYVSAFFPEQAFAVVLGQRDGVPRKPDPAGANEIIGRLNLAADKIVYLGDSGVDMQTSAAARIFPVGATWGFRSREELLEHGARRLVDRPLDLLALFEHGR